MKMKTNLFNSLILTSILTLAVSCKEQQGRPDGGDYKTLNVTLSDRTLYSSFSATIRGNRTWGFTRRFRG